MGSTDAPVKVLLTDGINVFGVGSMEEDFFIGVSRIPFSHLICLPGMQIKP